MTRKLWTVDEKIELFTMKRAGASLDVIASHLNKSYSAVLSRCYKNNSNRDRMSTNERCIVSLVEIAARAKEPCPTNYELAAQTGMKAREVSKTLKNLSAKGIMEMRLNKCRRRVAYIYDGLLSTKDSGTYLEDVFHGGQNPADAQEQIKLSSMALLRRQLETGAHWITCPQQFRAACESVGLAVA